MNAHWNTLGKTLTSLLISSGLAITTFSASTYAQPRPMENYSPDSLAYRASEPSPESKAKAIGNKFCSMLDSGTSIAVLDNQMREIISNDNISIAEKYTNWGVWVAMQDYATTYLCTRHRQAFVNSMSTTEVDRTYNGGASSI